MIDRLSLKGKLTVLIGFLLGALILVAAVAFIGDRVKVRAALAADAYSRAAVMHMEGDMMHDAIRGDVLDTLNSGALVASGSMAAEERERLEASVAEHADRFSEVLDMVAKLPVGADSAEVLAKLRQQVTTYLAAGKGIVALAIKDHSKGQQQFPEFMTQFSMLEDGMGSVSEMLEKKRSDALASVAETERNVTRAQWLVTLLALIGGAWLGFAVLRSVLATLGGDPREAMAVANSVANNDLTANIAMRAGDRQSLMYSLSVMQANLRERVASEQLVTNEMLRIKIALDNVSTGVMIADAERKIIYTNSSVQRILKEAESDIKKVLPTFNADNLIGQSIDQFHKNPAHQAGMLASLKSTYSAELSIGTRRMQVIANPVINNSGERLGAVAEWKDRTEELTARERELAAAAENLRVRMALDSVNTPVRIADNDGKVIYANHELLNVLRRIEDNLKRQNPKFSVDSFVGSSIGNLYADPEAALKRLSGISTTVDVVMDIGGRTFRVVTTPVVNSQGERLGTVGEWQDRTDQLAVEREIATLVSAAASGDLAQRVSTEGKTGFYATLADGLNQLVSATQTALDATLRVLERVAKGDLTQTVDANLTGSFGQLRDDTNATINRLREVVGQIKEATDLINIASKEIAAGNTDLSSRTEEQASSLEETASSMEELNSTVKQNAENALQANALARTSNDAAVKSGEMVQQIVSTMTGISESSKKIADIIGVIDSIAFQTNILALNAAVEAARAGEQGRGFAVVATEVRNLAQRSATAAKEIKELIAESTGKVDAGTRLVGNAGTSMDSVVSSFRQVTALVMDIAHASREQASGIEQVTQAVGQMDEVTQQNAALVEQAAAAAESLEEQARALAQAVAMFKLDNQGSTTLPGPALRKFSPPGQLGHASEGAAATKVKEVMRAALSAPVSGKAASGDEWEEF